MEIDLSRGKWRRLKALIVKEWLQIIRDPSTILISVILPLFLLFLYGFGVSLDMNHLRIGLVLEDSSPGAQSFAASLLGSRYFETKVVRNRRELDEDIIRGTIRGFIVIPSYFSNFRYRQGIIAPIQVIADGSEPNTANFVRLYAQGVMQIWQRQELMKSGLIGLSPFSTYQNMHSAYPQSLPIISSQQRVWYNEQLESRYFLLSGSLAIIMTLIGTLLTALVVSREWERGTMESMMSTPVSIVQLVIGKLIPYFLLGIGSMFICIAVSVLGYGLPLRGSLWLLIFVSAIFLFAALGLGLLISTIAKNQIVAYQISMVTGFLPAYILSGFLFEIASMPKPIQWLTYILPARYFVQCLQTIFLVGNVWSLILFNIIPMITVALIFFAITAKKTVKRLD